METQFYITLTLRTHKGLESFAKFFIGNNRHLAFAIFKQLKGSHNVSVISFNFKFVWPK